MAFTVYVFKIAYGSSLCFGLWPKKIMEVGVWEPTGLIP